MLPTPINLAHLKGGSPGEGDSVMSVAKDLEPEGLTEAEENAERSETPEPPEPPPDSPSTAELRARLRERLRTRRSEDRSKAVHRNLRSSSPEY